MRILILILLSLSMGCANQAAKESSSQAEPIAVGDSGKNTKTAGSATAGVLVIKDIVFGADVFVSDAVKNECQLLSGLSNAIKTNAEAHYASVLEGSAATTNADVLSVEVVNLVGGGGGAWSGGKSIMLKGTLSRQGKVLGNFRAMRASTGGVFGGFKGTCAILNRCVKTLGKDVANWLQNPTPNAALGTM